MKNVINFGVSNYWENVYCHYIKPWSFMSVIPYLDDKTLTDIYPDLIFENQ